MKIFLKSAILTSAIITLSACGIMSSPNDYSHASSKATIADKPLSVVQKDVDTLILESSQRIEKQLSLLNETKQTHGTTTRDYKVSSNQNIKELSDSDVELMIEQGRTTNNPSKKFDKLVKDGVTAEKIAKQNTNTYVPTSVITQTTQVGVNIQNQANNNIVIQQMTQSQEVKNLKNLELNRRVTLSGDYFVTDLIKELSKGANYKFKLNSKDKQLPLKIGQDVNSKFNGTIKEALINIGNSLGNQGQINVDMKNKLISLEYK